MASSRRTYDTDSITLRTVFAKNPGNSNVPALRVLTADGTGGTYWAVPSSLGLNPSFNEIITSAATYTADLSYNKFRLLAGQNIGMVDGPTGSNQTTLFGKAFSDFDISGGNSIAAFSNNQLDPSVKFAGENGIVLRADPTTHTLFIGGGTGSNTTISTGIYGFSQLKVTPSASTITSSVQDWGGDFLTASSPSTLLRFLGYNDIQLSTNVTTNSVFFTISTFTSQGYLNISNAAFSAYPSSISTANNLYVLNSTFVSTVNFLSAQSGGYFSSVQSTISWLAISTGEQFYILTGLINARATIDQLNSEIGNVNSNLVSTTQGLGSAGYISTAGGGSGDVTKANLTSTVAGLATSGYVSSFSNLKAISTGFLVVSSLNLLDTYTNDVNNLTVSGATLLLNGSFVSGTGGGGGSGDVTKANLTSTVAGLATSGYVSSFRNLEAISTGFIVLSSLNLLDTYTNDVNNLTVSGATLLLNGSFVSGGAGGGGGGGVTQLLAGTGISVSPGAGTGIVTVTNTGALVPDLVSTVAGLGTYGYVSTNNLWNLVSTNNLVGLVSTVFLNRSLVSTTTGLGTLGYVSAIRDLVSTNNLLELVSTPNLLELVSTPNLLELVSTANLLELVSTNNLLELVSTQNLVDLISSPNLTSTMTGLYNVAVTDLQAGTGISLTNNVGQVTVSLAGGALTGTSLTSSIIGLGTVGYVSTLGPTTNGISTGFLTLSTVNLLDTYTNALNYLTVSGATLLLNGTFVSGGAGGGGGGGVTQLLAGTGISLSPGGGTGIVTVNNTGVLGVDLVSTVTGLGTNNYVSTLSLVSTTLGLQRSGFLSTSYVTSTVVGLGAAGYVSTGNLTSTVVGLGTVGYFSSLSVNSTIRGLGQLYVSTLSTFSTLISRSFNSSNVTISTLFASNATMSNLTVSTITFDTGDGFIDFPDIRALSLSTFLINTSTINVGSVVSTQVLEVSSIVGVNFMTLTNTLSAIRNLVSTNNLVNLVSTIFLDRSLVSTTTGLGTLGYASSVRDVVSTPNLVNLVSTIFLDRSLVSTTTGLGTLGYASSVRDVVSTVFLDRSLVSTTTGLGTLGYVSTNNLVDLVSTTLLNTTLRSTTAGLGTSLYVSTLTMYSTTARWADYQATNTLILASTNAVIVNPTPYDPVSQTNYPMKLQTDILIVYDSNNAPGNLQLGGISFLTSTTNETYSLGFGSLFTGSVSSFTVARYNGQNLGIGSMYLSSLYLGASTGQVYGQLTTDETATNLYWNGTQLGAGGGGGITTPNLTSTVRGLGTAGYISTAGGGGGITAAQLTSTATRWATYPAVCTITFSNSTALTQNQIVSPGATFLQLVTDLSVLVTTSTTVDGITPFRGVNASQYGIADQINLNTLNSFNYTYNLVAGQLYTGAISTPTITNYDNSLGSLYLSSLFLAAPEGLASGTAGALTTDATATKLYYSTNQLANVKVNVVFSSLNAGAGNPQLFSYDIGKYFLFSTTTASLSVNLPPVENGWNAVIKNLEGSTENFTVNTRAPATLAPGVTTTVVCDGSSFYAL